MKSKILLSAKFQPDVEKAAAIVCDFVALGNSENQHKRTGPLCNRVKLRLEQAGISSTVVAMVTSKSVLPKKLVRVSKVEGFGITKHRSLKPIDGCNTPDDWKKLFCTILLPSN